MDAGWLIKQIEHAQASIAADPAPYRVALSQLPDDAILGGLRIVEQHRTELQAEAFRRGLPNN